MKRSTRLAWYLIALIAAALILSPLVRAQDAAAVQVDCDEYSSFAATMTLYRDLEANPNKVLEVLRGVNPHVDGDVVRAFELELRRVWAEGLTREDAEAAAFKRCVEALGKFPRVKDG